MSLFTAPGLCAVALMTNIILYFLLGASFMFTSSIAWIFWRKGGDRLSRLVLSLMLIMSIGFVKDAFFMYHPSFMAFPVRELVTSIDVVAVPVYAFILIELCDPGRLTLKGIVLCEAPFVVLPVLLTLFGHPVFYYVQMILAVGFGLTAATWTSFAIPRYHRYLKDAFSYDDDINLKWLQAILWSFFIILSLWISSCLAPSPYLDIAYMASTLLLWVLICYFLYRHKSVVDELRLCPAAKGAGERAAYMRSEIFERIKRIIEEERIYLDPMLKLSDIARRANTNRSYASAYFSQTGATFYDHINRLRIDHALRLLADPRKKIDEIAEESGFNSRQSFCRVFSVMRGMSPSKYRKSVQTPRD